MSVINTPLTSEQIQEFNEQGYIALPKVFSASEIADMSAEADRILELSLNVSLAIGAVSPRLDISVTHDNPDMLDVRKLQPVKDMSETFERVANDERFLAPMRQIMGYDPILMEEKLNYKQKVHCPEFARAFELRKDGDAFFLHHDWGYYRAQGYPEDTLSSAICIDETTPDNGPLRVIPGTHKKDWPMKFPDPSVGIGYIEDGIFGDEDMVDMIVPAGSVLLFHSKLLHDSVPNQTDQPRRLMIYSHYPNSAEFPEDFRNRTTRERGQQVEEQYRRMVANGEFKDVCRLR